MSQTYLQQFAEAVGIEPTNLLQPAVFKTVSSSMPGYLRMQRVEALIPIPFSTLGLASQICPSIFTLYNYILSHIILVKFTKLYLIAYKIVTEKGVEPLIPKATDFKSVVYASSTTQSLYP